jgi:hypothetical protein
MSMNGLNGFLPRQAQRALGDVDRVVADALQIVVDLERPDEKAQVDRHRLLQGEQVDRLILDLHLHPVDLFVGRDDLLGFSHVRFDQSFDRMLDLRSRPRLRAGSGCAAGPRVARQKCSLSSSPSSC